MQLVERDSGRYIISIHSEYVIHCILLWFNSYIIYLFIFTYIRIHLRIYRHVIHYTFIDQTKMNLQGSVSKQPIVVFNPTWGLWLDYSQLLVLELLGRSTRHPSTIRCFTQLGPTMKPRRPSSSQEALWEEKKGSICGLEKLRSGQHQICGAESTENSGVSRHHKIHRHTVWAQREGSVLWA